MTIFESVVLGVVQGLTEFIPVSSSGHLILVRELLGINGGSALAYDAVLQLFTSFAIIFYFRQDIWKAFLSIFGNEKNGNLENGSLTEDLLRNRKESKVLIWSLVLGTIPAVLAGLFLEDYMATVFRQVWMVSWMLILGSVLFLLAEWFGKKRGELTVGRGFVVGLFQVLSLFPGMSRAGATISGGLFAGLTREAATRFAFLLGFPVLFGSGLKKLIELGGTGDITFSLIVGSVASFFVGLAAIHFLIRYLKTHTLLVFVIYRLILAVVIIILL
ncbi:MAG: undecaprenyl-diphosphate phosphatase [bacterium]|nr:undecaprenyl-diphosphate phosphatase [bacterium]